MFPFGQKFDEVFTSKEKWYKKYIWFLLFSVIFFAVSVIPAFIEEGLEIPHNRFISAVCLSLFVSTGLFFLMLINDKIKQLKNKFIKMFIIIILGIVVLIWLLISVVWMLNILGD
ncbi:MAG: hypothetical protein PHF37_02330 [Phycisphaerae bacterium]|nr:hypothetical protein [Phycisphaerae bacterium]